MLNLPALGDLAYYVFRPFVIVTDLVWGTDLKDCTKCKKRRKAWNALPYSRTITIFIVTLGVVAIAWWVTK